MVGYLKDLIESGELKAVLDRTYRLDQIVEAYRYVQTRQKIGNVVISFETSQERTASPVPPPRHGVDAEPRPGSRTTNRNRKP